MGRDSDDRGDRYRDRDRDDREDRDDDRRGGGGRGGSNGPPMGPRGKRTDRVCHYVDYKDVPSLRRTMSAHGKIYSRKRGGNCPKCQRLSTQAIKRARFMGLLSYTN
jgi:ribosomal protein S18